jgi:hypothetical protein
VWKWMGTAVLWFIVWRVVVICYGYCVASGGNVLCFIVWQVVVIFYGLLCGEWW